MLTTMMDFPLSTQMILRHGRRIHAASKVGTSDEQGFQFTTFEKIASRVDKLASALKALGVSHNTRVATYCWNHQRHLECYLTVPSLGAVLHTLNIRLFPEQIVGIMNHAQDSVLIIDGSLLSQIANVLDKVPTLSDVIVIGDCPELQPIGALRIHRYDTLVEHSPPIETWPELDERQAAVVCYTSGTTGAPKGVVYSHRSIFLHTLATLGRDTFGISQSDRILLLPSMFHANAWGLPFSAWLAGADLLLPGPYLKASDIRRAIASERPTFTALVPTLINDLLLADVDTPIDMSSFRVLVSGGSAVSTTLIRKVRERWGIPVLQGWGMTETSPMCCLSIPPRASTPEEEPIWRAKSGRPVPGMEVRIVGDSGKVLPNDGHTIGELQLRGPWVTGSYHNNPSPESFTTDGWLRTGDVGFIDSSGYVQITDRTKDVIKSGGEWISSLELENRLAAHPCVAEVGVIGIPDARWEERPLVFVVTDPKQAPASAKALRDFLVPLVARFAVPENFAFIDALPKTSVGKIDKVALRQMYSSGKVEITRVK
jgi:fatty-acyl-CoA synthase